MTLNWFCCLRLGSVLGLGKKRLTLETLGFVISQHNFLGGVGGLLGGWSKEVLTSDIRLKSIVRYPEFSQEGVLSLLRVPKFSG